MEGAPIPIDGNFIKDEKGNMVVSKLDEATLEQIALSTGGAYIRATNRSLGLDEIVKKINEVEKKQLSSSVFEDFNEQYQYLIGIGLLLLLIEFVMLERKSRILSRLNFPKTIKPAGKHYFSWTVDPSVKPAKFERIFAGFSVSPVFQNPLPGHCIRFRISTYQTTRTKMYKITF